LGRKEEQKKMILEDWVTGELIPRFENRILTVDAHTASIWGIMRGSAQRDGHMLPVIDALLAASAIQHHLILVTENTKDFIHTGARLFNPCLG